MTKRRVLSLLFASLLIGSPFMMFKESRARDSAMPVILPMRQRAALQDRWLEQRLERIVPALMKREGIDMWVLIAREYNEDPVVETMLPATWMSARRRTILVFAKGGAERLAIARYDVGGFFKKAWDKEQEPDQWKRLGALIGERNPKKIGLNISPTFALGSGLSASQHQGFMKALPEPLHGRVVSAEKLAIGWLETRLGAEMEVYPMICRIAHVIIAEGLSERVIQPGVTTTGDVEWWYRERIRELALAAWFHPSVRIQRAATPETSDDFSAKPDVQIIKAGDLLHVDFGITYLGLNTDTQQHAYVLRPGEKDAPEGLKKALTVGNRLQDILTEAMREGRSGNDILAATREKALAEGIQPSIYTHPIGFHGHGAGPTIGLWDQQGGVPGPGDYPLYADTAYSIELNATVRVPEWDKEVKIMLEEDAFFDGKNVRYIDGRQTELLLVPRR